MTVLLLKGAIYRKTDILYLGAGTIFHISKIKLARKQQQAESSNYGNISCSTMGSCINSHSQCLLM